ncbi:unnamed protein product [Prunus armeniaca]|uniref:Uncharacterized protein n=1 Tax=Prunus armeniaca TaxID=36596 RepID=A0A6J5XNG3_PRUAR|nr:unnamed protein product [Prunus armeniaca]
MCIAVKKTEGGKSADQKVGAGVGEVDEEAPLLQSSSPKKTGRVKSQDADNLTAFIVFCVVIFMIICFVFSGSLSPKGFSTPSVQLGSFSADPFSIDVSATTPKITAHWNITFFFTNPYGSGRLIYRKLEEQECVSWRRVHRPFCAAARGDQAGAGLRGCFSHGCQQPDSESH